ncbi:MAG: nucleotidyltransferase family protein [Methanomassiliicoccales archaeon]|nr:MAG: nucleotidyltransferase family protein [Methanomassiliicoccales archaeon]
MNVLDILKKHEMEIKNKFSVSKIGLFGSSAREEQIESSDIDILVEFEEPSFDRFMDLSFFLEELLGKPVDLVTTNGISPYIETAIRKEVIWV